MFKVLNLTDKNLIALKIDGKIRKEDYQTIMPLINGRVKEFGKIRLYLEIESIDGIEPAAFKEDFKSYIKHFNHLEKTVVVGQHKWEKISSKLASPFVSGEVRYYDQEEITDAVRWILE